MVFKKYAIVGALCISTIAHGADSTERRLQLVDPVIALGEALVKKGYAEAQAETDKLHGTIPDLYTELTTHGYRTFLTNNPEIESETLRLLNRFENASTEADEIQTASEAWNEALKDPKNIDAWSKEFKLFSLALMKVASDSVDSTLVVHPLTKERILLNNGKSVSAEDRTKMGSYMAVIVARHSQRYNAMGHDAFVAFTNNGAPSAYSTVVASLPIPQ